MYLRANKCAFQFISSYFFSAVVMQVHVLDKLSTCFAISVLIQSNRVLLFVMTVCASSLILLLASFTGETCIFVGAKICLKQYLLLVSQEEPPGCFEQGECTRCVKWLEFLFKRTFVPIQLSRSLVLNDWPASGPQGCLDECQDHTGCQVLINNSLKTSWEYVLLRSVLHLLWGPRAMPGIRQLRGVWRRDMRWQSLLFREQGMRRYLFQTKRWKILWFFLKKRSPVLCGGTLRGGALGRRGLRRWGGMLGGFQFDFKDIF